MCRGVVRCLYALCRSPGSDTSRARLYVEAAASLEFQLITAASLAHNHRDEETHSSAGLGCGWGEIMID